jgi:SAM-dependent methyltransferase
MSPSVSKILTENYANYYERDTGLSEWRRLGALDKAANILQLCSRLQHDNILEIGCGDGSILERLAELKFGSRWTGLEISPSAIERVQEKTVPGLHARLFDGYKVPFDYKTFDLAILSHVIEHVEHPRQLIYEAARVVEHVFIEVPLEDNWRLSHDFAFDHVGHINFYSMKTIRRLVQSCGMRILDARLSHGSLPGYAYRKGKWGGALTYFLKEFGLRTLPLASAGVLTYNYSMVFVEDSK